MENSQIDWFFPCGKSPACEQPIPPIKRRQLYSGYEPLTWISLPLPKSSPALWSCQLLYTSTICLFYLTNLVLKHQLSNPPPLPPLSRTVTNLPTSVNKTQFLTPSTRLANNILDSFVLFGGIAARKQLECSFKWYFAAKFPWWMDKIVKECTK